MSIRFTWVLGFVVLVSIAMLVACSGQYSASNDGLVITPSQGFGVVQSFSFNLLNGSVTTVNSNPTVTATPNGIVLDHNGDYAYVISQASSGVSGSQNLVSSYKVNSDGSLTAANTAKVPAAPVAIAIDSQAKFLFVAEGIAGAVSVFAINNGAINAAGAFPVPPLQNALGVPNLTALAITPTLAPPLYAPCSVNAPPKTEYLYVTDAENNVVWEFQVDSSTGALGGPAPAQQALVFAVGSIPSGVAIDTCNRFAYVSNLNSNSVSAFTICMIEGPNCKYGDGSLVPVTGSPFNTGNGPGPLTVSAFGTFLYVVDTYSDQISGFQIGQGTGALSPLNPATVTTGPMPVGIAARSDGNWIFVADNGSTIGNGLISQYSVTPATGALTPFGAGILTDNYPWGVAVK